MTSSTRLHRAAAAIGRAVRVVVRQGRRLRSDRVLRAFALGAAIVLILVEAALGATLYGIAVPVALALAVVHAGALPLAARTPNVAAPLSLAAALTLQLLSAPAAGIWPWWPALITTQTLVLAAVAARTRLLVALLHWVLALATSAVLAAALRPQDRAAAVDLVVFGSVTAGAIVIALTTAQWQRVRSELLQERRVAEEEAERRLLAEERSRIARELHDVVAHSLSLITVQTSTARFRHPDFNPAAVEEFERIGAQSRQALDEMRGLLRVLRSAGEEADHRPQPGLQDVPELVEQAADTGARVVLEAPPGDWTTGLARVTGLAAYRIVQEAMSNALRHAPGAQVQVTLRRSDSGIVVEVTNTAAAGPSAHASGRPGHGLIGMTERAASVGGSVRFGSEDGGGYAVRAVLPLQPGRQA